jgi:saccharopine dehydrogenase-like NADP-dependent oxidoreductase
MRILVLGGSGIVGRAVVKDLAEQKDVAQIVIGDLNVTKAEQLQAQLKSNKVSVRSLDVSDHSKLVETMKGFDVVGNCVYYETLLEVTQAAIEAKVHVADLGGMFHMTKKQMNFDGAAKKAGVTILACCGSGPGLNNVLARYGADKLDRVDEIHIRGGAVAPVSGSSPLKGPGMTIRTVLDEFSMNPIFFENGQYKEVPPLSGREGVRFSEPIGEQPAYFSLHTEPLTLGKYIKGVKVVTFKVIFPEEEIEKIGPLVQMGLTSTDPMTWGGKKISPRQILDQILVGREEHEEEQGKEICATILWVTGVKGGESTKLTYEYWVEHEKRWGNTKTGVPFAIGLLMLGRRQVTMRGFAAPEQCINPIDFITELKKRGFIFKETEERIRNL